LKNAQVHTCDDKAKLCFKLQHLNQIKQLQFWKMLKFIHVWHPSSMKLQTKNSIYLE